MRTNKLDVAIRAAAGGMLLAALLAGCAKPAPAPAPEAPMAAPPASAEPDAVTPAESLPPPDGAPAAPAQPAPDAPPPTEPSAAPKPTAANEPALDSMQAAVPSAKMSVAVDLHYSFDGAVLPNQPVTLHLAAVPRVAGTNLKISVKETDGVRIAAAALDVQKATASSVYRQQLSVTRSPAAPAELRVLVTMDMPDGSAFGFFSIPFDGGTSAQKRNSVKQR
jgi:hypothetical protein